MARRRASGEALVMGMFAVVPLAEGDRLLDIAKAILNARRALADQPEFTATARKPRRVARKRKAADAEAERAVS